MKLGKKLVLFVLCLVLGIGVACGVKGPPRPYLDVSEDGAQVKQAQKEKKER
jgi:hypothetical protein